MDLARNVFIAVHVDDKIVVGSSSQLWEVVGEMQQYFTMKVTPPLSASSTRTYVGARYLRHGDAIWELPTTRYVTGMLNEQGKKDAKPVVTPAVNRNDDDDEVEEASAEEHRTLRRIARSAGYDGYLTEATSAKQSVLNPGSVHRQQLGWRSSHTQVRVFVGDHAGWILAQCQCPNTVGDCSIIMRS